MSWLYKLYDEKQKRLPRWVDEGLEKIEEYYNELLQEKSGFMRMKKIHKYRQELKKIKQLACYGFNSAKFDLPTLAGPLLKILKESGRVNILKKRTSYITISNDKIIFKDVLKFHSPCNYEKFVSLWGTPGAKSIWPYQFFSCVEDIQLQKTFPKRSEFANHLHGGTLPEKDLYIKAKTEFYRRKLLPRGHKDKLYSMRGFLRYYNIQDVRPLAFAIINCFESYKRCFDIDPHYELSLPSIALKAMIENFEHTSPLVYTFGERDRSLAKFFRDRIYGGLTNVYHRHIRLYDSPEIVPDRAKYSESGHRFTAILRKV